MIYLVTQYWPWLLAAGVVGVVTPLIANEAGWAADLEDYWLVRAGVVLALLIALVVLRVASGRPELMLEAAAGLVVAYILGGIIGGLSVQLLPARFEGWWVGLFATGLILLGFGITTLPKVEPDLRERVAEVVKTAGADPLNFDVSGRDVLLPDDLGDKRAALSEQVLQVKGVRLVSEVEELSGAALAAKTIAKLQAEAAAKAEADAKAKAEAEAREAVEQAAAAAAAHEAAAKAARDAAKHAKAKAEAEAKEAAAKAAAEAAAQEAAAREAAANEAAGKEAVAQEVATKAANAEEAKHAAVAPPVTAAAAASTRTADAAGTASIPSVEACQSRLSALVAAQKINFERRSAEIVAASRPVLKELAAVIAQCPAAQIEVAGHTDALGKKAANEALSKRRAEAVVVSLTKAGIGSAKLTAVGYGASKPLAANDTAEGRATNRRIEFVVK